MHVQSQPTVFDIQMHEHYANSGDPNKSLEIQTSLYLYWFNSYVHLTFDFDG